MSSISEHISQFRLWLGQQGKDSRWCILVSADPDALASAMALKRLLRRRVQFVSIARINTITRPDNLAMIRYLRISNELWNWEKANQFTNFAMVDSQPSHSKAFTSLTYDLVIDHHPLTEIALHTSETSFVAIHPSLGATSTFMAKLLKAMGIRPGPLLATAMLYGIRTDTSAFERSGSEEDLRAYQWLTRYANSTLLRRICRSEYLRDWLPLFARAFNSLQDCRGDGAYAALSKVGEADTLVAIADFFTKIHGLHWIAVSGVVGNQVIVIFRGDGGMDMGQMARSCFGSLGEAGGHRNLARAEFPVSTVPHGTRTRDFIHKLLSGFRRNAGVDTRGTKL